MRCKFSLIVQLFSFERARQSLEATKTIGKEMAGLVPDTNS